MLTAFLCVCISGFAEESNKDVLSENLKAASRREGKEEGLEREKEVREKKVIHLAVTRTTIDGGKRVTRLAKDKKAPQS